MTRIGGYLVHFIPFYPEYPEPVQIDAHLINANRAWWLTLLLRVKGIRPVQVPEEGEGQWDYSPGILSKYFMLEAL